MRDGVCEAFCLELILSIRKIAGETDLLYPKHLGGSSGHQWSLSAEWRTSWAFLVDALGHLWTILCESVSTFYSNI